MTPTIYELMDQIGCQTWPERWTDIYGDVMTAFETRGCPMTDPGHIAMLAHKASGISVFPFVFHRSAPDDFTELPKNTRLERALKEHYLSGKVLHEMYGFFL